MHFLEQAGNLAGLGIDVDAPVCRVGSRAGHHGDRARHRAEELRAAVFQNVADRKTPAGGLALLGGIVGQGQVGLVTGLAWTSVGGETLEVEAGVMDGSGKLELTGNLGDVMKESAHAAMSYIRANAGKLGIAPDFYKTKDIHVHFPEGAVPKDGPSAGVTVCTAIVSALTGVSVRRDVAMTGEISLRGRVMRIGGLREKTMAALRHGIRTVIIPADNERDLEEIDQTVRRQLNFITAQTVDTVLDAALNKQTECASGILPELPGELVKKPRKPQLRQ